MPTCEQLQKPVWQAVDFDPDSLRKIMPAAVKVVANAMDAGKKCAVYPLATQNRA